MADLSSVIQRLRALGLCVIPSGGGKNGKHPLVKWEQYQKHLPTDAIFNAWLYNKKPSLWGIVTGEISGVVIVDCDSDEAVARMKDLKPNVKTPGGGFHYWFAHPGSEYTVKTTTSILPKIDIRADGGFANTVGINPKAEDGIGEYQLLSEIIYPLNQMPSAIRAKLTIEGVPNQEAEPTSEAEPATLIPEGKRNSTLTSIGGIWRRADMAEEEIYAGLWAMNLSRCQPPLEEKEVHTIAESLAGYEPAIDVHRSDTGNASIMVDIYGDTLRYDHKRKRWLRWGKHRWETNYDGHISRLAQEIARERQRRALVIRDMEGRKKEFGWGISSESRGKVEACVALAKIMEPIADDGTNWDRNIMLLGTPNGVIDLRTGDLRPGKAEDRITMSTGVDFNPNAECPRWELFLMEIFDDTELIDWLWRVLGYSIIGETTEQIFVVGYGEGSNGKSKFFEAVCNALGDYAYYTPFATFGLPAPSSTNDLAALEHRRFVTSSETNIGTRLNIERIKAVSGGDKMTARFLYQEFETYQPHLKLWLFVNHLPDINDDTIATWRRVRLIPFTKTFIREAEDKRLGDKLKAEAQGILAWLVRGCLEWQKRGLTPVPQCVRAATGEYRRETDTLISFINDRCIKGEGEEVRARQLYLTYKTWAEGVVGRDKVLTETAFGRQMGKKYEKKEKAKGIYYLGIDLADKGRYIDMTANEESE